MIKFIVHRCLLRVLIAVSVQNVYNETGKGRITERKKDRSTFADEAGSLSGAS